MSSADAPLITSLGLASNLGAGIAGAAAAQRAGLSRRTEMLELTAYEPGDEMEAPIVAAQISGVTDGFMQPGLWLRLASLGIDDLIAYGSLPPADDKTFWRRAGIVWVLPEIETGRFHWTADDMPALLQHVCAEPLVGIARLAIAPAGVQVIPGGAAAAATALERVADLFGRTSLERVIVLATDSWLDPFSVRSLVADQRLKSGELPVGLCPGEAGVALLIERPAVAAARGTRGQARIAAAVAFPPPPSPEAEDDPHTTRLTATEDMASRLAAAVQATVAAAGLGEPFAGTIVLDLSGEEWRARVWGSAQTRLLDVIDFDRCTATFPAISFGDTGAASGLLGLCLATRAFARGYAAAPRTLVCSISEGGAVGAVMLEAP